MNLIRRKMTTWIALTALLFSALSPAMASVLFSDRPDILARVLGAPAKPVANRDICHDTSMPERHGTADRQQNEESGHGAHGIFCSFCLASSSVVTLPAATNAVATDAITAAAYIPNGHVQPAAANLAATRHPRDPPPALR
jgi:hypothetical protein